MKKLFVTMFALLAVAAASAQSEVIVKFNEGATALQSKNYTTAITNFETVIDKGMDSEDPKVTSCVATAKKYLPVCYQGVGLQAASQKNYPKAIEYLQKAADTAELYGNTTAKQKANMILAKVYQVQGGEAFNAKDYATAASVFEKGYKANPRNTDMALNLATSYCELGKYDEGMAIYDKICKMPAEKYADAIAKAQANKTLYTNNKVASLQQAGDFDGVIAMADKLQAASPALAEKIRIEAYNGKKEYAQVIALGDAAAAAQANDEDKCAIYFIVGAAYNAKYNASNNTDKVSMEKAVEYFKKVTAGANVEAAKAALADLTK
ncbi:MAG: tetratricopeptide repeat protein [Rikenellaceae bacterium]|nr:tetratricopeptide repeat protein [Rikenellaceae bacterium]